MNSFFSGIEGESLICAHCGYCQAVCPVFSSLGWESSGPRGRMTLARLAAEGQAFSVEQAQRIYQCTLCGACREVCATRIDTDAVWLELRRYLAEKGNLEQTGLAGLRDNLAKVANITGEPAKNRLLWQDNLERSLPGLNQQPGAEVLYFVGCVAGLYPQAYSIPAAMTQILERSGIRFTTLGGEEACCGFPLVGMGLPDQAAALARRNLDAVRALGIQTLITTCPSCYHTWRDVYPQLLGEPLNFEVLHATEYMQRLSNDGRLALRPLEKRVTYHDPCDLGRNSGIYEPPRQVIQAIPGVELVEMVDNRANALCCGGGGNLEVTDAGLAAAIADQRINQAYETGASILVTPCQQCKRTLSGAARREKLRLKIMDITELIAQQLE